MRSPSLWSSFRFAARGLWETACTQRNARFHFIATSTVAVVAKWLEFNELKWCILLLTIGLVLMAEVFNTALETVVDLVSPEHHELARRAKDASAGAVLVAAMVAVMVGLVLFIPPLLSVWQAQFAKEPEVM